MVTCDKPSIWAMILCLASASSVFAEVAGDVATMAGSVQSTPLPGPNGNGAGPAEEMPMLDYYVVVQPVQELLEAVAADGEMRLVRSDEVKGFVRNLHAKGTLYNVLDVICAHEGLDWFAFNGTVYVSARSEVTTRLILLGDLSWEQAMETLTEAGLPMARFHARPTSSNNVLAMSGPPELLAISETLIESIPVSATTPSPSAPVRSILVRRGTEEHRILLRN